MYFSGLKRFPLLLAALLPLAGCGNCLNPFGGSCSTAEGIGTGVLLAPVVVVALPFLAVYAAADAIGDAADSSGSTPAPRPRPVPSAAQPSAVRECRPGEASCVIRVSCPPGTERCAVPSINQSCPSGQRCEFRVPRP